MEENGDFTMPNFEGLQFCAAPDFLSYDSDYLSRVWMLADGEVEQETEQDRLSDDRCPLSHPHAQLSTASESLTRTGTPIIIQNFRCFLFRVPCVLGVVLRFNFKAFFDVLSKRVSMSC